ncbi:metal ABC transporter ATP-binding protein [Egibacter rhizosphaerae]|uniref:metal ABC transporter ATP-binding protein n=1 Tax=Egibacter rhizosphaerae TaxID=1670831 RepID=UPI0013F15E68|nr:metal ABC transporter ATP-binding protein [Egibacter rhizosphaerae]
MQLVPGNGAATSEPPAVAFRDVAAGYGGRTVIGQGDGGIDWRVERGAFVGVAGPSGAGKTTLVRLLTGQAERHRGRVEVHGHDVARGGTRRIGYVPQLGTIDWDFPLTVEQTVLLGGTADSRPTPWFSRRERRHARALLDRLGIGDLARRHIRELSGGQQQRMFLARAMVRDSDVLLLDEPTSGVDLRTRLDILELLGDLNAEGLTVVLTTHDLNWVAAHLPRVAFLNGRIVAEGAPADVVTPGILEEAYGSRMRVVHADGRVVVTDEYGALDGTSEAPHPPALRDAAASVTP